jgi:hypothetical protein
MESTSEKKLQKISKRPKEGADPVPRTQPTKADGFDRFDPEDPAFLLGRENFPTMARSCITTLRCAVPRFSGICSVARTGSPLLRAGHRHAQGDAVRRNQLFPASRSALTASAMQAMTPRSATWRADLAMGHGSTVDPAALSGSDLADMAKDAGMRMRALREIAAELCAAILPAATALRGETGLLPAENILRIIGGRVHGLADALGLVVEVDVPPYIDAPLGWPPLIATAPRSATRSDIASKRVFQWAPPRDAGSRQPRLLRSATLACPDARVIEDAVFDFGREPARRSGLASSKTSDFNEIPQLYPVGKARSTRRAQSFPNCRFDRSACTRSQNREGLRFGAGTGRAGSTQPLSRPQAANVRTPSSPAMRDLGLGQPGPQL